MTIKYILSTILSDDTEEKGNEGYMKYIREKPRDIPVWEDVDVLVVGGGPSGVAAAAGAARAGGRCAIVERLGSFGGMWTNGLVLTLAGYNSWLRPYRRCVDGIGGEWLRRAASRGFAEDNPGWVVNSEPEGMKLIADEILKDAGVIPLLHCYAGDPIIEDDRLEGMYLETIEGRVAVLSRVVVDCTGDGSVFYRAGADFEKGKTLQPMSLAFEMGNVEPDPAIPHDEPRLIPIGPEATELAGELLKQNASRRLDVRIDYDRIAADAKGGLLPRVFGGPWFGGLWKDVVWINSVRVPGDATSARELTNAEMQAREDAHALVRYFRATVPGFEGGRLQRAGSVIGVRETRRLKGRYTLTGDDVVASREFDDAIGLGCWSIDVHPTTALPNHSMFVPRPFQIPYRTLVPETLDGLLVAGRCISVDRIALASVRVGATCTVTGHAAGVAAALAARSGKSPAALEAKAVREELGSQSAILGPIE